MASNIIQLRDNTFWDHETVREHVESPVEIKEKWIIEGSPSLALLTAGRKHLAADYRKRCFSLSPFFL